MSQEGLKKAGERLEDKVNTLKELRMGLKSREDYDDEDYLDLTLAVLMVQSDIQIEILTRLLKRGPDSYLEELGELGELMKKFM